MSAEQYFDHYNNNGYNFTKTLLSRYCLSLYTKPFVILSGISGTGKTKIAQLFKTFENDTPAPPAVLPAANLGYIIMNMTKGVIDNDGRGNLKFSDLNAVFEQGDIPDIEAKIQELRNRQSGDNITEPENFTIQTADGEFTVAIYLQRASSPLLRVRFISKRGEVPAFNSQDFIKTHFQVGDVLKLQKVAPRTLQLVAVNEIDVINLNNQIEHQEREQVENKLFISVKSNWTDNTELFGYYNALDETYYVTPLLKFILSAKEFPTKPFFLILDEMNLSRVEHYFSDYLSCLESRTVVDNLLIQEKIQLHNFPSDAESNDLYFDVIPNKIEIPENLYVTGTVNIDETTYTFSPKVLDRANVIEFNEVDLSLYNVAQVIDEKFVLNEFPKFGSAILSTSDNYRESPQLFKDAIGSLLQILQPYNLHFGYRVINEMSLFIKNTLEFVGNDDAIIMSAIDIQISQKILPKFNGAFGKLDEPVRKLIEFMLPDNSVGFTNIDIAYIATINVSDSKYPESLKKLSTLYKNLVFNGFASFLE